MNNTLKPLITDLPKKQTTSVQRTDHLPPIDRTTNLNSKQQTLMSPRRTLTNTKLPPKTDSETIATPTNSLSTLVDGFHKIVRHHRWIQRPGITAAYRAGFFCHGTATESDLIVFNSPSTHYQIHFKCYSRTSQ